MRFILSISRIFIKKDFTKTKVNKINVIKISVNKINCIPWEYLTYLFFYRLHLKVKLLISPEITQPRRKAGVSPEQRNYVSWRAVSISWLTSKTPSKQTNGLLENLQKYRISLNKHQNKLLEAIARMCQDSRYWNSTWRKEQLPTNMTGCCLGEGFHVTPNLIWLWVIIIIKTS